MSVEQPKKSPSTSDALNYELVKETYSDVKDEVTDFVKKNPWASLAIAAGVGFILGKLLSGRKE